MSSPGPLLAKGGPAGQGKLGFRGREDEEIKNKMTVKTGLEPRRRREGRVWKLKERQLCEFASPPMLHTPLYQSLCMF